MTVSHYISGHWHKDGELSTTRNPGTGQPVTTYHQGTVALLEEAVAAAPVSTAASGVRRRDSVPPAFWKPPTG